MKRQADQRLVAVKGGDTYTGKRLPKVPTPGFVEAYTWTRSTRTHHVIAIRTISLDATPGQIIAAAAAVMRPRYRVVAVTLTAFSENKKARLELQFGRTEESSWSCSLWLRSEDVPRFTSYILGGRSQVDAIILTARVSDDDNGGEELPLPTISKSALAAMQLQTTAVS